MKLIYIGSKFDHFVAEIDRSLVPGESFEVAPDLGVVMVQTGPFRPADSAVTTLQLEPAPVVTFDASED